MDEINIVVRPFNPDRDEAMVYSTWRNSSFYSAMNRPTGTPSKYFHDKTREIKKILTTAQVRIACFQDDPLVIVGYCVFTGNHLDWIYVKEDFRKKGIGTLLMPKQIETVPCDLTKTGKVLADKKNLLIKGESNGRNDKGSKAQDPKEVDPDLH